jgi:hypothetical protein
LMKDWLKNYGWHCWYILSLEVYWLWHKAGGLQK